ncbi:MAG: Mrr restriction system protein [bacterium ADurb.Bin236]|nr:MAG: Mrr restriction system protein [bacterium ADurb.Bin236]HOY63888.1 restriction endonuclease [bacterium]HPN94672.1 restriction endonuclease [bacterium]
MAIPDFQSLMLPILKLSADGEEHLMKNAVEKLADEFKLSEEERKVMLPSRRAFLFYNRVAWAKYHLSLAGLLESTSRGVFRITQRGIDSILENPKKINLKYLSRYPEYAEARKNNKEEKLVSKEIQLDRSESTPEELLEEGYLSIRQSLAQDILANIKRCSPSFFERTVIDLLLKMGYGGSRIESGKAVGKSGDEGIDGIIDQDRLGLDSIYIQAKKWDDNPVGRPEIMKFAGAIQAKKAKKGVFITTSRFTKEAHGFVGDIDSKIILIDGEKLAELMIDFNVGASTQIVFEIKKIDTDYFLEE